MPRIVVGVPVYNGANYLERSLAALVAQPDSDFEILVSDNGSTDATPEIAARFAAQDRRVRVVRHSKTIEQREHFDWLLGAADCKLFAFRAHDDWSAPDWVGKLAALLDGSDRAQLAVSHLVNLRPDGSIINELAFPEGVDSPAHRLHLLRTSSATWFYGMYKLESLRRAWRDLDRLFPHRWAHDHAIQLPFILGGHLVGTNETKFYCQWMPGGAVAYRPRDWAGAWRLHADYWCAAREAAARAGLPILARAQLALDLPKLAGGRTEKLRRILRGRLSAAVGGAGLVRPREKAR